MVNVVNLNANDSSQVNSAQKVSILTGEPNTWLLIYSGIALQRQRAEGDSGFLGIGENTSETDASVSVTLDNISGVLLSFATTASMANIIEENTWGQWIIWDSSLSLRDNGDLVFTTDTTVVGIGDAEFYAFYYYVNAKVILDEASISGTIRWAKNLVAPLNSPHFVITADMEIPGPPGQFGSLQVEATGTEGALDSSDVTYYYVPYVITGPLLGKTLTVQVSPIQATFSGIQGGSLVAEQISGPVSIALTTTNRHATDVDFEMKLQPLPQ